MIGHGWGSVTSGQSDNGCLNEWQLSLPIHPFTTHRNMGLFWATMFSLGLGSGLTAVFGSLLAELFPTEIRSVMMVRAAVPWAFWSFGGNVERSRSLHALFLLPLDQRSSKTP